MAYDSRADTLQHILRINELLHKTATDILNRADAHDRSKLEEPEKSVFDEYTPKLKGSTFGSDEYKGFLVGMGDALKHHYQKNKSHHPNAHPHGINDMNLLDMVEMLIDWKAASERHDDGDIMDSITTNAKRFHMSEQLEVLFRNTAEYLKFGTPTIILVGAGLGTGFALLPEYIIEAICKQFDLVYYHNNCLPMYEATLEEFQNNCLAQGAHSCQYYFYGYQTISTMKDTVGPWISQYLKGTDYEMYDRISIYKGQVGEAKKKNV